MFIEIKRLLKRLEKIDVKHWRNLILLMLGAFFWGMFLTHLNIASVQLLLQKKGLFDVGFLFICIGVLTSFIGRLTVKLDRRKGYGGVPLSAGLFVVLLALLWMMDSAPKCVGQFLFVYQYVAPVILQVSFWMIAGRFISLRLDSFKFVGIFACEWLGFLYAGCGLLSATETVQELLVWSLCFLGALILIMKGLVFLSPVPGETFVRKSGGVQDNTESKLVSCIFLMTLIFTTCQAWSDALFYHLLSPMTAGKTLATMWLIKGMLGFILVCLLRHTSYTYHTVIGVLTTGVCFILLGGFSVMQYTGAFYTFFVLMTTLIQIYWPAFLQLLPRLLSLGNGVRIRWYRDVLYGPLGWVLAGATLLSLNTQMISFSLMVFAGLLLGLIGLALSFYNKFFIQMCQNRRWCFGPKMLLSQQAVDLLKKGIESKDVDEVIYFYLLMSQTGYAGLTKQLLKGLHHPDSAVRLFCVQRLDKQGLDSQTYPQIHKAFSTETDQRVRSYLLATLIHRKGEENAGHVFHKFGDYLDDSKLNVGAILGFLQSGGECALLAMDGLQRLSQSKKVSDIFKALEIIEQIPKTGLVRLVLPLLKHPDIEVVKRAIVTAGHIGHTQSLSFILSALDSPELQESALRALKMYDKLMLPPIEKMIGNPNVPFTRRKTLVSFLRYLPSGEGKQILLRQINVADQKLRKEILRAILDSKIVWSARPRKKVLIPSLLQDIQTWHWMNENEQKCAQCPDPVLADSFGFLNRSFMESKNDLRLMILYQLMILYPNDLTNRAIQMILKPQMDYQINGIELLQDLISGSLYQKVYPILMAPWKTPETKGHYALDKKQAYTFLRQLILNPHAPLDRWTIACVLYGLKQVGSKKDLDVLQKVFPYSWQVVQEACLDLLSAWTTPKEQAVFVDKITSENPTLALRYNLKERMNS